MTLKVLRAKRRLVTCLILLVLLVVAAMDIVRYELEPFSSPLAMSNLAPDDGGRYLDCLKRNRIPYRIHDETIWTRQSDHRRVTASCS
jgi:flagellar biosynthesis/type III secretory pathway M-ring protein FliF/YscJ